MKTNTYAEKKVRLALRRPEHKERSEAKGPKKAEMTDVSRDICASEDTSAELLRNLAFVFSEAIRTSLHRSLTM